MATYYSSFFSSGLLASNHTGSPSPLSSGVSTPLSSLEDPFVETTTPRASPSSRSHEDITPTSSSSTKRNPTSDLLPSIMETGPTPPPKHTTNDQRPKLRRRRSSLTAAASPLSTIKSNGQMRSASQSVQVQRHVVGGRSRAGSVTDGLKDLSLGTSGSSTTASSGVPMTAGVVGRARSGSLGTALRHRVSRHIRKQSPPVLPAPTSPLPDLPPLPSHSSSPSSFSAQQQQYFHTKVLPPTPPRTSSPSLPPVPASTSSGIENLPLPPRTPIRRPPLSRRSYTETSVISMSSLLVPIHTPQQLSPLRVDEAMDEDPLVGRERWSGRDVVMDYPSPIDTPGERMRKRERAYF